MDADEASSKARGYFAAGMSCSEAVLRVMEEGKRHCDPFVEFAVRLLVERSGEH